MFPTLQRRSHRVAATTIALATALLVAVGVTGATADSKTTTVTITPLTPAKVVTTGAYVGPGKTYAFVASGGSTTVPTNALVVQVAVTVKGTGGGTLSLAPQGDPTSASPTKVSWNAGGSGAGTVKVNVGTANKVVVTNSSTAAATVGITINGYSTQTTAAGINGSGGTIGQVLTNNGNGTVGWATPAPVPTVFKAAVNPNGVVTFGNLTAARVATGNYQVTADRNLKECAVTVAPGFYAGNGIAAAVPFSVTVSPTSPTATVRFYEAGFGNRDTSFFVTVIC